MDFEAFRKNIKYIPSKQKNTNNKSGYYTKALYKSELDRYDNTLNLANKLLQRDSFYIPNFFCEINDKTIFDKLKKDLDSNGKMISWSKHFKHEDPSFSETFNDIINKMADYFKVKVLVTRLNYYPNGDSWKPMHKDKNAHSNDCEEDFTMGASFGASRILEFKHDSSEKTFKFPQNNGDIFAFSKDINMNFIHGVPKASDLVGPRFSVIAWGKKII